MDKMKIQETQNHKTLEEVQPGERGTILRVGNERGPVKRRLVDMGLTPGTQVMVLKQCSQDFVSVLLLFFSNHFSLLVKRQFTVSNTAEKTIPFS